jgi:hypothetical protein
VLLTSLLFLTGSSEVEGVIWLLAFGPLPSAAFLRLELPLGATPFNSFFESLAVKLTKIADPKPGFEAELAEGFLAGLVGVEGIDLFRNCLSLSFLSGLGLVPEVCRRFLPI